MSATIYTITDGGPWRWLARKIHLSREDGFDWHRLAISVVIIVYAPLVVAGGVWFAARGTVLPAFDQITTHVRALVAIPLLLVAEPLVDRRAHDFGRYLLDSNVIGRSELDRYQTIIAHTARARDSWLAECVIFICAAVTTTTETRFTGPEFAYASMPAIAVFRFLLLRWVWRWLLWGVFLWRLSRLQLALRATHPDRLAGLGPVLGPSYAFGVVAGGFSSNVAAVWFDRMLQEHLSLEVFINSAITYVLVVVVVGLVPASGFFATLYRARIEGLRSFGAFTQRFVSAFEERWSIAPAREALMSGEIQSLCDVGQPYAVIEEIKVVPWSRRLVLVLVGWSIGPMLPLAFYALGVPEILRRLSSLL